MQFPLVQTFWEGETFRCLGAAVRTKRKAVLFFKVYAIALYVEADRAAKEFNLRDGGGFLKDDNDFCDAIVDGAFHKVLQLTMVRDVTTEDFVEAIDDSLRPSMEFRGELGALDEFSSYMMTQQLNRDVSTLLFWNVKGFLDVAVLPSTINEFSKVEPGTRVSSSALSRGLFELYLGANSIVPKAKKEWAAGSRKILASVKE